MLASILLLLSAIGVIGANSLLLSPLVTAVGNDLQVSAAQVMQAASAYGLGVAAAALLLAPLGDRIGAGRLLRAALVILAFGLAASALAPTILVLIAAQAVCGLAAGAALPSIYTLAMTIAPRGREAQTLGAVLTGWTVSLVLGVSAGAWLTDLLGWRAVYIVLSVGTTLLWLLSSGLRQLGPIGNRSTSPLSALKVPGITRGLLATLLLMLSFYTTYFFIGAHVTVALGLSTTMAGFVPLCYGLGFGLAVLADPLLDRLGLARATSPVFLVMALIYAAMMTLTDMFHWLLVTAVVWGVFQHLGLNLLVARLTTLDPSQRGAIMGLYSTVTYLSIFAVPTLGGLTYANWGMAGCLAVSAVLCLAGSVEARSLRRITSMDPVAPDVPA